MKKKNLLVVLFVLATAAFYSCSSSDDNNNNGNDDDNPIVVDDDPTTDDNTPGTPHLMQGEWKADTFSYQPVPGGDTYTFSYTMTTGGCATDYLTIKAAGVADLKENKKNNDNECEDVVTTGTWTPEKVTFSGTDRTVISYDQTTLKLKYPKDLGGAVFEVTVEYSRQ